MLHPAIADFTEGDGALLTTAIHAGSAMRPLMEARCALSVQERVREEDPFTDRWADIADNRIIGLRSRFEVDLNRPREKAVYQEPEDAWGLQTWHTTLPQREVEGSLKVYDEFYARAERLVEHMLARHPFVIVYDLHSYNHQRSGPGKLGDPEANPEINLGTANLDRTAWALVVEQLIGKLHGPDKNGRIWDVRENIKFRGGHFTKWLHERFGKRICPIAIEFKKIFMDEWTGIPDQPMIGTIRDLLARSEGPVLSTAHASWNA